MPTGQLTLVMQRLRASVSKSDSENLSDAQLLERFVVRRDSVALEALVHRHGPMVWGVCRRLLSNYHDAEDAFQATFLVLARKAASIHPRAQVGNWLYGVAHQTSLKARATMAKRRTRERQQTDIPDPAADQGEVWADLQPLLDRELSLLPDRYRAVIVLCDLEGKTRLEVARLLGCPEGTVNSRLTRARTILARRLSRCGVAVSGGALAMALAQNSASASVPVSTMAATVKAVSMFAVGDLAAPGIISSQVSTLTEGVIKAMFVNKLKTITALVFVFVTFGASGSLYLDQSAAAKEPQPPGGVSPFKPHGDQEGQSERSSTTDGFAGSWDTTYGPMTLTRDGNKISGSYEMGNQHCTIEGKATRRRFTFTYQEPSAEGEGWFELSDDGKSFEGKWRVNGQEQWNDWTGTRTATVKFSGSWQTTYGPMKLHQKKQAVTGFYDMGGQNCTVEGKIEGRRLVFTYVEPSAHGEGWFELSSDGQSFAGEWRAEGNEQWNKWEGTRVKAERIDGEGRAGRGESRNRRVKVDGKFAGSWTTTYGPMTLTQSGAKIYGSYEMGGQRCLIVGKIENGRFEFAYGEPSVFGEGWFELSKDGASFSGKWRENGVSAWNDWTGERTGPEPSPPNFGKLGGTIPPLDRDR